MLFQTKHVIQVFYMYKQNNLNQQIYLCTFASRKYIVFQNDLLASINKYSPTINTTRFKFSESDLIKTKFYKHNKEIFMIEKGFGLWLWKPFFIYKSLKEINNGDILIYADSAMLLTNNIDPLIHIVNKNSILLFNNNHINKYWTKRDCFVYLDCDKPKYWNSNQAGAFIQLYKKSKKSLKFVKEWLKYCSIKNLINDSDNIYGKSNFPKFISHRHDQSILSLLSIKNKIELYPDPTQYGSIIHRKFFNSKSNYSTLFYHHRGSIHPFFIRIFLNLIITCKRLFLSNY